MSRALPSRAAAEATLRRLRKRVDRHDRQMLTALAARLGTVKAIGAVKREAGLPLLQKARMSEVLADRARLAAQLGLRPDFTRALFRLIQREALRLQAALPEKS